MLLIKDLDVFASDKQIIKNLNLSINDGKVHVIMGPNGAGKSTICKVIFNHYDYNITGGSIIFNDEDITNMDPSLIAKKGIYILNQSPLAIEGVSNAEMLRIALEEKTGEKVNLFKFNKKLEEVCKKLSIDKEFIFRDINLGMSGGERKKNELLHMWMLEPSFVILDEVDSGLDVDAIKIVANNLIDYKEKYNATILIVTHHENLINMIKPDYVHILKNGTIVQTGNISLANEVLSNGFDNRSNVITESDVYE